MGGWDHVGRAAALAEARVETIFLVFLPDSFFFFFFGTFVFLLRVESVSSARFGLFKWSSGQVARRWDATTCCC